MRDSVVVLAQLPRGRRATIVGTVPQATSAVANRLRQLGFVRWPKLT